MDILLGYPNFVICFVYLLLFSLNLSPILLYAVSTLDRNALEWPAWSRMFCVECVNFLCCLSGRFGVVGGVSHGTLGWKTAHVWRRRPIRLSWGHPSAGSGKILICCKPAVTRMSLVLSPCWVLAVKHRSAGVDLSTHTVWWQELDCLHYLTALTIQRKSNHS